MEPVSQNKIYIILGSFVVSTLIVAGAFYFYLKAYNPTASLENKCVGFECYASQNYNNYEQYSDNTYYPTLTPVRTTPIDPNEGAVTPLGYTDLDLTTPRVMFWYGKVNQHWSLENKRWETDPDASNSFAGADVDPLVYCKMFYPKTIDTRIYKPETIDTWHDAGNTSNYTATINSIECVQPS